MNSVESKVENKVNREHRKNYQLCDLRWLDNDVIMVWLNFIHFIDIWQKMENPKMSYLYKL